MILATLLMATAPAMVVIDENDVKRDEAPPHGAIGLSTAYRISDAVPSPRAMEFRKRVLHPGAAIGLHRIDHDEVYYVLSGQGEVSSDGSTRRLTPGMAAYLYAGANVGIEQVGTEPLAIIVSYPNTPRTDATTATAIAPTDIANPPAPSAGRSPTDELVAAVSALDTAVFDAFNQCGSPEQLGKHADYFAPEVEFYHDTGGVTWNRADMIANTAKFACGNFRRELVPGSLRITPVKDFGAIAQGVHRFCQFKTGACEGEADFVILWRLRDGKWQITRVLSYGHRASKAPAAQR